MKKIVILFLLMTQIGFAQTASREDISQVLDYMSKQGVFKAEDIERARVDLMEMSDSDWKDINKVAKEISVKNEGIANMKKQVDQGNMPVPSKEKLLELKESMKEYENLGKSSNLNQ